MKVITWETLYYEDHGATLKHKCGKRIVALSLLSFFLIFFFLFFLLVGFFGLFFSFFYLGFFGLFFFIWASLASFIFHKVRSLIPNSGGIIVSIILSSLGQCSNNDDHHTFIFLTTRYLEQNMTLYECLQPCTGMCNESRVTCMKNY